ncbi:hypothetical protein D3C72_1897340 [compost metagenome]
MRNELVWHEGRERQIDQREGVDNREQQPAAILRRDNRHHRTNHQADQRADVQHAQILYAAVARNNT